MSRTRLAVGVALATAAMITVALLPLRAATLRTGQEDDIVTIGDDVQPPKKTKHVSPIYPEDARAAGIQGVVIIQTTIDKEGKVANAEVIKSVPELDQAALDAVLQWEFEPTYVKGKKVRVRMTVTVNFTLAN